MVRRGGERHKPFDISKILRRHTAKAWEPVSKGIWGKHEHAAHPTNTMTYCPSYHLWAPTAPNNQNCLHTFDTCHSTIVIIHQPCVKSTWYVFSILIWASWLSMYWVDNILFLFKAIWVLRHVFDAVENRELSEGNVNIWCSPFYLRLQEL